MRGSAAGAVLGDRVVLDGGVRIADGVRLDDDVFVGPNATSDTTRRVQAERARPPTVVHEGASIGANVTILAGLTIGARARDWPRDRW